MPPHPFSKFEIQNQNPNDHKFNGVYSRNNLPKIKGGAYVTNLDEFTSIGTHCIAFYVNGKNIVYFDSFGDGYIPKEIHRKQKYHSKYL